MKALRLVGADSNQRKGKVGINRLCHLDYRIDSAAPNCICFLVGVIQMNEQTGIEHTEPASRAGCHSQVSYQSVCSPYPKFPGQVIAFLSDRAPSAAQLNRRRRGCIRHISIKVVYFFLSDPSLRLGAHASTSSTYPSPLLSSGDLGLGLRFEHEKRPLLLGYSFAASVLSPWDLVQEQRTLKEGTRLSDSGRTQKADQRVVRS